MPRCEKSKLPPLTPLRPRPEGGARAGQPFARINPVQKSRTILAAVLLLVVWMAAPALRCLVPDQVLTPEERACCKAMAGHCGESSGSEHPCCKRTKSKAQPAAARASAQIRVPALIRDRVSQVLDSPLDQPLAAHGLADPSPPPGLQGNAILRI